MRLKKRGLLATAGVLLAILPAIGLGTASAQQAVSPSYMVNEVFFGTGGELEACSADGNGDGTSYCSKQSAGETAVGETVSPSYKAQGGFNTNREEYLEFVVTPSQTDLGVLSTTAASVANGSFYIKNYMSNGYVVHTTSDPPRSGGSNAYTLTALASPTGSIPGTEQFGMNLVANTAPYASGASPVQVPDSTFSFGTVAAGYNTANAYKYAKGDIVASSTKETGQTNYTVTYLFNISNTTPAGQYTFNHNLVVTSTF
jgi:hypothetical protein